MYVSGYCMADTVMNCTYAPVGTCPVYCEMSTSCQEKGVCDDLVQNDCDATSGCAYEPGFCSSAQADFIGCYSKDESACSGDCQWFQGATCLPTNYQTCAMSPAGSCPDGCEVQPGSCMQGSTDNDSCQDLDKSACAANESCYQPDPVCTALLVDQNACQNMVANCTGDCESLQEDVCVPKSYLTCVGKSANDCTLAEDCQLFEQSCTDKPTADTPCSDRDTNQCVMADAKCEVGKQCMPSYQKQNECAMGNPSSCPDGCESQQTDDGSTCIPSNYMTCYATSSDVCGSAGGPAADCILQEDCREVGDDGNPGPPMCILECAMGCGPGDNSTESDESDDDGPTPSQCVCLRKCDAASCSVEDKKVIDEFCPLLPKGTSKAARGGSSIFCLLLALGLSFY